MCLLPPSTPYRGAPAPRAAGRRAGHHRVQLPVLQLGAAAVLELHVEEQVQPPPLLLPAALAPRGGASARGARRWRRGAQRHRVGGRRVRVPPHLAAPDLQLVLLELQLAPLPLVLPLLAPPVLEPDELGQPLGRRERLHRHRGLHEAAAAAPEEGGERGKPPGGQVHGGVALSSPCGSPGPGQLTEPPVCRHRPAPQPNLLHIRTPRCRRPPAATGHVTQGPALTPGDSSVGGHQADWGRWGRLGTLGDTAIEGH